MVPDAPAPLVLRPARPGRSRRAARARQHRRSRRPPSAASEPCPASCRRGRRSRRRVPETSEPSRPNHGDHRRAVGRHDDADDRSAGGACPAGRPARRRQPCARHRRLDPGVDLRPPRRSAVRPPRPARLGGRGRRRDRPAHRVRPAGAATGVWTPGGTPPSSCSAATTASDPVFYGAELERLLDELAPLPRRARQRHRVQAGPRRGQLRDQPRRRRSTTTSASSTGRRGPATPTSCVGDDGLHLSEPGREELAGMIATALGRAPAGSDGACLTR